MTFQLSSGQGTYMLPPGNPSVRLAAFVALRECAGSYPEGTPFDEDGYEAARFKFLTEYENLERQLDVLRRVVETKFPERREANAALAGLLFQQLAMVVQQLVILKEVNGKVVLAYNEYLRPDYTERILALDERLTSLFKEAEAFVNTTTGTPV